MNEESQGIFSCKGTSWIAAVLLAFAAYLVLRARYDVSFIIALVISLVLAVLIAWVLKQYFCAEVEETEGGFAAKSAARAEERRQFESDRADARAAVAAQKAEAAAQAAEASATREAAEAQGEALLAEGVEEEATAVQAEVEAGNEKLPAEAAGESRGDGRPAALDQARDGAADDLKLIKGVGPKLEKLLNSLGIYHFDQIAGWGEAEIAWMDENLEGFKGRVSRDDWVSQAQVLAAGGTTDFADKVKKGDVYD